MLPHYREHFLSEHMGGKLVSLLRKVFESNVRLTLDGRVLSGTEVKNLTDGKEVIPPEDVRTFLDAVREIGGWDTNANFVAIEEFLEAEENSKKEVPPVPVQPVLPVVPAAAPVPSFREPQGRSDTAVLERPVKTTEVILPEVPEGVVHEVRPAVAPAFVAPLPPANDDVFAEITLTSEVSTAKGEEEVDVLTVVHQSPPREHPSVAGLRLQRDGYYWNPAWDK